MDAGSLAQFTGLHTIQQRRLQSGRMRARNDIITAKDYAWDKPAAQVGPQSLAERLRQMSLADLQRLKKRFMTEDELNSAAV